MVEALLQQALAVHRSGDIAAARAAWMRVLAAAPEHPDALHLLGVAHLQQGRAPEAAALLRRALAHQPGMADAWAHLAAALVLAELPAEAAACWRETIRLRPGDTEARRALSVLRTGPPPEPAEALYRSAEANYAAQHFEIASTLFRQASLHLPDPSPALINAASALLALARPEPALAVLEAVPPGHAQAWRHRAAALTLLDRPHEALAACRACLALDPDNVDAGLGEATTLLSLGDFERGWPLYERRHSHAAPDSGAPLWLGETPLAGRRILLRAEQGFGDILQFARFAKGLNGHVILAVPPELLRLMQGLAHEVVDQTLPAPAHDVQTPLMSLPLALRTTLATIPPAPYLQADPLLQAQWAARLGPRRGLRVGVAWAGDPATPLGWLRSVPHAPLLAALIAAGAEVHVVQKQVAEAMPDGVRRHGPALTDFAETAALLAEMDVVVSSCTSVAHLAGALGRPLLLMLQFAADFRWLRDRADTPWYPSARLFRQPRPGDWDSVIAAVAEAVSGL